LASANYLAVSLLAVQRNLPQKICGYRMIFVYFSII